MAIIYKLVDKDGHIYIGKLKKDSDYMSHHMKWSTGSIYPWESQPQGYRFEIKLWRPYIEQYGFDSISMNRNNFFQSISKWPLNTVQNNIEKSLDKYIKDNSQHLNKQVKKISQKWSKRTTESIGDIIPANGKDFLKMMKDISQKQEDLDIIESLLILVAGYHASTPLLNTQIDFLSRPNNFLGKSEIARYLSLTEWYNKKARVQTSKVALPTFFRSYKFTNLESIKSITHLMKKYYKRIKKGYVAVNYLNGDDAKIVKKIQERTSFNTIKDARKWFDDVLKLIDELEVDKKTRDELSDFMDEQFNKIKQGIKSQDRRKNMTVAQLYSIIKATQDKLDNFFTGRVQGLTQGIKIELFVKILRGWVYNTSLDSLLPGEMEDTAERRLMEHKWKYQLAKEMKNFFDKYWNQEYYQWKVQQKEKQKPEPLNLMFSYKDYLQEYSGYNNIYHIDSLLENSKANLKSAYPNWIYLYKYWNAIYPEQVSYWLIHFKKDYTFKDFYRPGIKHISNIDDIKYY